jgi:hypothetical protein
VELVDVGAYFDSISNQPSLFHNPILVDRAKWSNRFLINLCCVCLCMFCMFKADVDGTAADMIMHYRVPVRKYQEISFVLLP